jgi:vitamin B12 transporter
MRPQYALLLPLFCVPALAAEPDATPPNVTLPDVTLPDVAITATRTPTPLERIPAGVTVITRQMIQEHGFNTLTDALVGIPGVRVSPAGGPGGQASVFVRGSNSNHVLVLRDGMPINDPSEATGAFNFGVDTLSDIERIEVVRGPMAALYGSGAIGGVINMISRRGRNEGVLLEGDLAGGAPAQVRGAVAATGVTGRFDYAVTAETQSQRGYDAIPQRMTIYRGVPQGFRDRVGTVNLGFTPVEGTRLSLFLRGRQALFGFNNLGFPTYDNANSSGSAESFLVRGGVTSTLFDGLYETSLFVGRLQDGRHYRQYLDPADPNQASGDSRYNAYRTDIQWNNTVHLGRLTQSSVLADAALTFGYQHIADAIRVRSGSVSFGFPFDQFANASMNTNALHTGLQATLWDRLDLTGQVRQDWVGGNAPTTWRIGGVVRVPEVHTSFKLAYGTAFRAASLFDRFGVDSFGYVGNRDLKPESAQGWEAGFVSTLPAFGRNDFLTFSASYFNQQVRNLITTQFFPVYTSINIGSAHVQGVETELTLRVAAWLLVHATYTYTDTLAIGQPPAAGSRLLRRPPNTASVDLTIQPLPGLTIVPRLAYTGSFRDFLYDNGGFPVANGSSPAGTIASIAVSYDVTPKAQLYVNAWNVFSARFEPVNGFQTPGPSGIAGIRLRL